MTLSVRINHGFPGFALDVAFDAPPGITALFGKSGSGKTSVVNAVAGLLRPDAGTIRVADRLLFDAERRICVPTHRRRLGYVFQEGRLFPHLTVRQNLCYGRWFAKGRAGSDPIDRIVELLGIGPLLDRQPGALSGGEKQRVAIGRALLSEPELLLMDEPLAALDSARKAEILPYIQRLRDETDTPILYVSHSVPEVARIATTVVALEAGRVLRSGPAQAVLADPDVAPALGIREAGALLSGIVREHAEDGVTALAFSGGTLYLPLQRDPVGADLRVRIEAKDVLLATEAPTGLSALNIFPARIEKLRQGDGPGVLVQLRIGTDLVLSRVTRRSANRMGLAVGQSCYAVLKTVSVAKQDIG
ncbi:molybdenum import ATP-binding protein modC [Dinoroseobacter shibae DFL 12 = DSM 16493]|jgi:molybdate transport system ATP-binding protein|uniref:Molybdenum import ATP-binding protein modC n=1 Tax=Dinoroseobacter shibae (strain DSM 16493 / NCIMB 14021 / DFL 12) TaxID=398580 RepID=A8LPF1_DINSH|nr:molybdenum ABC transporter ATP-binding protein [Dinoroseobacter shibae]ABV95216.1 molybdenum import ATP-binding protein modC [Dinoroseobacter shibae DFL 12 = DSM 16493]URF46629.1 molybdenum ABC transporter ATP-binding protein [Dinoroseobacter shibae]URF50935.1 molybdenum ABC transporter ATP-binding protein [Dinoroseobacter shibae]